MFKILIGANPNPAFQEVISLLKGQGFELDEIECEAASPYEKFIGQVIERSQITHPDLVLLTPDLPENNSFKVCKNLKSNPQTEGIPIIFLSCASQKGHTAAEGLESGASDVLFIPNQQLGPEQGKEMLARIRAVLRAKTTLHKSRALADQLNQMNKELYERNLAVEQELYTTRQLQQSLLPPFLPDEKAAPHPHPEVQSETEQLAELAEGAAQLNFSKCHFRNDHLRISGVYLPCDALGGDLYDVIQFADQSIGVAIADVSGHGVPAAFVTAIFKATFYRTTHNYTLPGDILYHLNNELMNIIKTGQYVTGVYTRLTADEQNPGQYQLQYSGAGHPYPFYYCAETDSIERLQENGTPLAWFQGMEYPTGTLTLKAGDKLLMFSDGISEMKNAHAEMYGEENLGQVFEKLIKSKTPNMLDHLLRELSDFAEGHPLDDDVSVVLLELV